MALLARALVATSPPTPDAADLARRPAPVAGWRAARHGRPASSCTRSPARLAPAREVFETTVDFVRPALEEAGTSSG